MKEPQEPDAGHSTDPSSEFKIGIGAQAALDKLTGKGCQCAELFQLMSRIRRVDTYGRVPKAQVEEALDRVQMARDSVRMLQRSQLGRHVFTKMERATRLEKDLQRLVDQLTEAAKTAHGSKKPRYDDAVAGLVRYVEQTTKKPRDAEVSQLIATSLGLEEEEFTETRLRQWRRRYKTLMKGTSSSESPPPDAQPLNGPE